MSAYEFIVFVLFICGAAFISGWVIAVTADKLTEDAAEQAEQDVAELMKKANKPTRRVRAGQPWSE